jgi:hypothetical protein
LTTIDAAARAFVVCPPEVRARVWVLVAKMMIAELNKYPVSDDIRTRIMGNFVRDVTARIRDLETHEVATPN